MLGNPSSDIQGSLEERRSFHYFRSRNMANMPGNFEPYFWENLVLQFSHSFPTVQQSLVALSAIYEEHEKNSRGSGRQNSLAYSELTVQQYNKAVGQLASDLDSGIQDPKVALISCLIFVWIEFLQDNLDAGFRHLEFGLKILHDLRSSLITNGALNECKLQDTRNIYGALDRSFTRLRVQAALHGSYTTEFTTSTSRYLEVLSPISSTFSSIFRSRMCLDNELNSIFGFLRSLRDIAHYGAVDLYSIDHVRQGHLARLEEWDLATRRMCLLGNTTSDPLWETGIQYLQLYYIFITLVLKAISSGSEMAFDEYKVLFERMLSISEFLINTSSTPQPSVLSFDMGVIPPLFLVCLKCRWLPLRLQAIALLERAPEQEGLWRRDRILKYCRWKTMMEEQGRGNVPESEPLPEFARICEERWRDEGDAVEGGDTGRRYVQFQRGPVDLRVCEVVEVTEEMMDFKIMGAML